MNEQKVRKILENLSCPECKAFFGDNVYETQITGTIASLKSLEPKVEEIKKIIGNYIKPMYKEASEVLKMDLRESCGIQIHNLATAIVEYLEKGLVRK